MPFFKKLLYYGLLAALILIVIEGMARATYWLAFEGAEGADYPGLVFDWSPKHPVYGFTRWWSDHDLNVMPRRQKWDDLALRRADNRLRQPLWPLDTPLPGAGSASF